MTMVEYMMNLIGLTMEDVGRFMWPEPSALSLTRSRR